MSLVGALLFCNDCGGLLERCPASQANIDCDVCGKRNKSEFFWPFSFLTSFLSIKYQNQERATRPYDWLSISQKYPAEKQSESKNFFPFFESKITTNHLYFFGNHLFSFSPLTSNRHLAHVHHHRIRCYSISVKTPRRPLWDPSLVCWRQRDLGYDDYRVSSVCQPRDEI